MSFIAELKRRNVLRMAGLYLVGAWIIAQVAETLPIFGTPAWVLKTLVVLLALGFVPALVFSGSRRESAGVESGESGGAFCAQRRLGTPRVELG